MYTKATKESLTNSKSIGGMIWFKPKSENVESTEKKTKQIKPKYNNTKCQQIQLLTNSLTMQ